MALTDICCPHCHKEIRVELHVMSPDAPKGKGPAPIDLGKETNDLIVKSIEVDGLSYRDISILLMQKQIKAPKGGDIWYPASVQRQYKKVLQQRLAAAVQKARM
jgi:hypothetical protein